MYDDIRNNLVTLLTSVASVSKVYSTREPDIEGYPAVILDMTEATNETLTNTENLRKAIFTIYILQEVKVTGGAESANTILDAVSQAVIATLEDRANMTLSGAADWIEPVTGAREEILSANGVVLSQEIKLTAWRSVSTV